MGAATADRVTGDQVYVVSDGVLRIIGDELENKSLLYCPSDVPLHERFRVAEGRPGSRWWQGGDNLYGGSIPSPAGNPFRQFVVAPSSGRTVLTSYARADGLPIDPEAAEALAVDLHAMRNRVGGGKPFPGPLVATTEFEVPPPTLTLELSSSRKLCTAVFLAVLSGNITGDVPPYNLAIDGESVNPEAESHPRQLRPVNDGSVDRGTAAEPEQDIRGNRDGLAENSRKRE